MGVAETTPKTTVWPGSGFDHPHFAL
jgi:hypothetical protein